MLFIINAIIIFSRFSLYVVLYYCMLRTIKCFYFYTRAVEPFGRSFLQLDTHLKNLLLRFQISQEHILVFVVPCRNGLKKTQHGLYKVPKVHFSIAFTVPSSTQGKTIQKNCIKNYLLLLFNFLGRVNYFQQNTTT